MEDLLLRSFFYVMRNGKPGVSDSVVIKRVSKPQRWQEEEGELLSRLRTFLFREVAS